LPFSIGLDAGDGYLGCRGVFNVLIWFWIPVLWATWRKKTNQCYQLKISLA